MHFKTPLVIDTSTSTGSITTTGSIFLSGSTSTGVTFTNSGSLTLLSLTSTGASLSFPLNGLTITSSGSPWDGVIQSPEVTSDAIGLSLSGYVFVGTPYDIGNSNSELLFSGQLATITINNALF